MNLIEVNQRYKVIKGMPTNMDNGRVFIIIGRVPNTYFSVFWQWQDERGPSAPMDILTEQELSSDIRRGNIVLLDPIIEPLEMFVERFSRLEAVE